MRIMTFSRFFRGGCIRMSRIPPASAGTDLSCREYPALLRWFPACVTVPSAVGTPSETVLIRWCSRSASHETVCLRRACNDTLSTCSLHHGTITCSRARSCPTRRIAECELQHVIDHRTADQSSLALCREPSLPSLPASLHARGMSFF